MNTADAATSQAVQAAVQATRAGRHEEAARAWERVLAVAPDHPEALYFLGQRALRLGDPAGARQMLERAAAANPKEPLIHVYLALSAREMNDPNSEGRALERALVADPYCSPALLLRGAWYERLGRRREAAEVYRTALKVLPPENMIPPFLKSVAARAREAVKEDSEELGAFLRERLAGTRARHAGADFERFDECTAILAGTKKRQVQDPTWLYYPRLPPIPFYDRANFPWLADVEAATDVIAGEVAALVREDAGDFRPYVHHPEGVPLNQWKELNHSPRWSAYFLWQDGARQDAHCRRCPAAAAALEAAPLADMPGYAPAAFFSTLEPKTRIPPHTGVTNVRLIVHLPLIVPESCGFRVGNVAREWKPGEAWIFDDTIEHEAWNESDRLRVLLIFDIWNPLLSAAERDLVRELLVAMREYTGEGPPPG